MSVAVVESWQYQENINLEQLLQLITETRGGCGSQLQTNIHEVGHANCTVLLCIELNCSGIHRFSLTRFQF